MALHANKSSTLSAFCGKLFEILLKCMPLSLNSRTLSGPFHVLYFCMYAQRIKEKRCSTKSAVNKSTLEKRYKLT